MNKLQKILDIVREVNPETMKLSLGCNLKDNDGTECQLIKIFSYDGGNTMYYIKNGGVIKITASTSMIEEFKILGHTLYPSHLLVALEKKHMATYAVINTGELMEYVDTEVIPELLTWKPLGVTLNLTQPLEPQLQANPELVETLYKLLT